MKRTLPVCAVAAAVSLSACALPPGMEGSGASPTESFETLPPPGYGTLRQDEISLSLISGPLRILVTPLEESVTRVAAPDTYRRLSSMANSAKMSTPHSTSKKRLPRTAKTIQMGRRSMNTRVFRVGSPAALAVHSGPAPYEFALQTIGVPTSTVPAAASR